jgi:hypothetical protein
VFQGGRRSLQATRNRHRVGRSDSGAEEGQERGPTRRPRMRARSPRPRRSFASGVYPDLAHGRKTNAAKRGRKRRDRYSRSRAARARTKAPGAQSRKKRAGETRPREPSAIVDDVWSRSSNANLPLGRRLVNSVETRRIEAACSPSANLVFCAVRRCPSMTSNE